MIDYSESSSFVMLVAITITGGVGIAGAVWGVAFARKRGWYHPLAVGLLLGVVAGTIVLSIGFGAVWMISELQPSDTGDLLNVVLTVLGAVGLLSGLIYAVIKNQQMARTREHDQASVSQMSTTNPGVATSRADAAVATPPPTASEHPITKRCPYCAEDIKSEAIVCRYCGHDVRVLPKPPSKPAALVPSQKAGDQGTIEEASSGNRRTLQIVLSLLVMPFWVMAAIYLWIGWTANRDGYPLDYVLSQFLTMFVFLAIGGVIAWIASKVNPR